MTKCKIGLYRLGNVNFAPAGSHVPRTCEPQLYPDCYLLRYCSPITLHGNNLPFKRAQRSQFPACAGETCPT